MASLIPFVFQKSCASMQKPRVIFGNIVVLKVSAPGMPQAESQIACSQWFNSGHFQFGHIHSPGSAIYTYTNPIWLDLQSCCQAVETEAGTRSAVAFFFLLITPRRRGGRQNSHQLPCN